MLSVAIDRRPSFRPAVPAALFEGSFLMSGFIRSYDVAPDGRVLMTRALPLDRTQPTPPLRIVLNAFEVLRERAPVR